MMSLVNMSTSTPKTGQVDASAGQYTIAFGTSKTTITGLPYYKSLNRVLNDEKGTLASVDSMSVPGLDGSISTLTPSCCIPTNAFINELCLHDKNCQYYLTSYGPSPYYTDNSRNPVYYSKELAEDNALANFDGKEDTAKITAFRDKYSEKDYDQWVPGDTLANYPAASACDMFSPSGTSEHEWYLPSVGEIGYVIARFKEINEAITQINEIFGCGYTLHPNGYYYTSTALNYQNVYYWLVNRGRVLCGDPSTKCLVRAFRRYTP